MKSLERLVNILLIGLSAAFISVQEVWASNPYLAGYPLQLHPCSLGTQLQDCLTKNHWVRLEGADYTTSNPTPIIVYSGDQIYGLPRTKLPLLVLAAGDHDVTIAHISSPGIQFIQGAAYSENHFVDLHTDVIGSGAYISKSSFVRIDGKLTFDDAYGGTVRETGFIGCHSHAAFPAVTMRGTKQEPSYRNSFLWLSFEGQVGTPSIITNQSDLLLAGIEAESWNSLFRDKSWSSLLNIDSSASTYIYGADFGTRSQYATPFLKYSGFGELQLVDISGHYEYTSEPKQRVSSPWSTSDIATLHVNGAVKLETLDVKLPILLNGVKIESTHRSESIADVIQLPSEFENLARLLDWHHSAARADVLQTGPASNGKFIDLQKMIDQADGHIATLPPGTFKMNKTVIIPPGGGVIGAGSSRTVLVGEPGMDLFRLSSLSSSVEVTRSFVLANATLLGGRVGLAISGTAGDVSGLVIRDPMISDLVISDMSYAGILIRQVQGLDNVMIESVSFLHDRFGILQELRVSPKSDDGFLNYVDKTICLSCNFDDVGSGLAFLGGRQDNLDACVKCSFRAYHAAAIILNNNSDDLIALSTFSNDEKAPDLIYGIEDHNTTKPLFIGTVFHHGVSKGPLLSPLTTQVLNSLPQGGPLTR